MALKALLCPQCGAQLELGDNREYAFCSYCGTKIMLHETLEIKHSGSVQINNLSKANKRLHLADLAFAGDNYQEAYDFYTKASEDIDDNFRIPYCKALCIAFLSSYGELPLTEMEVYLKEANNVFCRQIELIQNDEEEQALLTKERQECDQMLADLAEDTIEQSDAFSYEFSDKGDCRQHEINLQETAELIEIATKIIIDSAIYEHLLEQAIVFFNEVTCFKPLYYIKTIVVDGQREHSKTYYSLSESTKKVLCNCCSSCKKRYDRLPSQVEKKKQEKQKCISKEKEHMLEEQKRIQEEKQKEQQRMLEEQQRKEYAESYEKVKETHEKAKEVYKLAAASFWDNHPAENARRKRLIRINHLCLFITIVIFILPFLLKPMQYIPFASCVIVALIFYGIDHFFYRNCNSHSAVSYKV